MKPNFKLQLTLLLLLLAGLFSACKKDDFSKMPHYKHKGMDGIWASEGYGYVLDIKNGKATLYHTTKDYAVQTPVFFDGASENVADWNIILDASGKQFVYQGKNMITNLRFNRLNKLPKTLENGGLPASDDPRLNFDVLWQTFEEHYAFFRERNVNWKAVREQYRNTVTATNFEQVVQKMLSLFNEDHVTLTTTTDDFLNRFDAGIFRTLGHFANELPAGVSQTDLKLHAVSAYEQIIGNILTNYVSDVKTALNNNLIWGALDQRTGYLLVNQMQGYELADLKTALNEALTDLNGYDQLVIDLRGNLGGSDRVALELAGRFINKPMTGWRFGARDNNKLTPLQTVIVQPTGNLQFTKPIRILTSIATASAAEVFTLVMKQRPQVKTVGEGTNGIFSTILNKRLPNGWTFSLSNEVLSDAQGRVYEVTRIPADIQAPFPTSTFRDKGIDPALAQYATWF